MHGIGELLGIGIIAICCAFCGMTMVQFRQPPIIGYIFAGVILGPSGLEFVTEEKTIALLAELGIILLLYFIGIELSLQSFRKIWHKAVLIVILQIIGSMGIVWGLKSLFYLTTAQAVLFSFCLAISSTAVAVTIIQEIGEGNSRIGQLVVGVLIAQDLAVAPMLLILNGFTSSHNRSTLSSVVTIGSEVMLSIALLVGVILLLIRKGNINLPFSDLLTTKPDLAPLAAVSWCFGFALVTGVMGLSPAFGAFLAGLIIGNSAQHDFAMHNTEPIKVILMMAFFLSVGLLIDLTFLAENFLLVLGLLLVATVFKILLNVLALRMLRESWSFAIMGGMLLGQMGEFSFVFGTVALSIGIIDPELQRFLVAVTVMSLIISPICVDAARRVQKTGLSSGGSLTDLIASMYLNQTGQKKTIMARIFAFPLVVVLAQPFLLLSGFNTKKNPLQDEIDAAFGDAPKKTASKKPMKNGEKDKKEST